MAENEVRLIRQEIKEMREDTNDRLNNIDVNVAGLTKTVEETFEYKYKEHDRRISMLEKNQRWVVLAILGAFITAISTLVLVA